MGTNLFLDEPQSRARMWDEVMRLRQAGTTVFLTPHYLEEADALCDWLAIIDHGPGHAGRPEASRRWRRGHAWRQSDRQVALNPLSARSFVRNHDPLVPDGASIRVYVDGAETALPAIFRILDQGGQLWR